MNNKNALLQWSVFISKRPGLNRELPPGYESLAWVPNSSTLIHGERDAVLVDTFLTTVHPASPQINPYPLSRYIC